MRRASDYLVGFGRALASLCVSNVQGHQLSLDAAVNAVIRLLRERTAGGGKIMFIGNGGSAAIASHQAVDYWKNGGLRAMAFNDASLLTCISNDHGYAEVFSRPITMFATPGDVLIAISSSGKSENILNGVAAARRRGCHVITLSGFLPDNPLRQAGDTNFYIEAQSYGFVEVAHLLILHAVLDLSMSQPGPGGPAAAGA